MNHDEDFLEEGTLDEQDELEERDNLEESSDEENTLNSLDEDNSEDTSEPENDTQEEAPAGVGSAMNGLKWTTLKNVISKKYFVPIALIFGLFVLILVIVALSYGGIGGGFDYIAPKCQQMRVTLGKGEDAFTQNLSIEEYIISHIYSATKNLKDIDADLYRVLAIVINTEVQSSGSCSRTYIPEVDDIYSFEIVDSESDVYYQIQKDIKPVKDVAMVKRKSEEFYSTSLDGFCSYFSLMADQIVVSDPSNAASYTIPQLNYFFPPVWVEENVDNWNFKNCPCNDSSNASPDCFLEEWNYGEDEEPDLIYVDGGTGTGVSIYAAHYLTSHENKTYEGVLKLFYPNKDWEFKTSDPSLAKKSDFNGTCTGGNVPFSNTPLTRSEFISLVTEFLSTGNYQSYAQYFIDYAGDIYDMGKRKNINPELIYIFARKETAFTANSLDTQHYNYYGMGHGNEQSHGTFYDSFMEGVEALFNYFVDKGSLEAVVKVYSYFGDWLYHFDSKKEQGLGGCYYAKIMFGENYSRCNSSYYCAPIYSGGKIVGRSPTCVPSTQEEKDAYIEWQSEKYVQHRQAIFKLGKEICSSTEGIVGNTDGTTFLNMAISEFLPFHGTNITKFNEKIIEQGCKHMGTGLGVANVAATAVAELASYGYKFHYVWGGMHVSTPPSVYGVPHNWGPYGPDCSGFVSWALYNAGFTWRSLGATDWGGSGTLVQLGDPRLQVGDFIVTRASLADPRVWSHIVIITKIDQAAGIYHVVHASSTANGVIFGTVSMNESNRHGVLMSNYYATATKSDAFANMCREEGYFR